MRNRLTLILSVIYLFIFSACEKEDARLDNFLVEFATIIKQESSISYKLDNGTILNSENSPNIKLENDNRVIISYTTLDNGFIHINNIRPIFVDNIKEEGYPDAVKYSPVKIISAWVSGKYLNMSFQVDYHSKPHSTGLYRDMEATRPTLYFSYSRDMDPPGAPTLTYLSFNIETLIENEFTLFINTYDGVRKFVLEKN